MSRAAQAADSATVDGVPVMVRPLKPRTTTANTGGKISNSSAPTCYQGQELYAPCLHPHADDSLALPSRIGDRLHYRDRRTTDMAGQPIESTGAQS